MGNDSRTACIGQDWAIEEWNGAQLYRLLYIVQDERPSTDRDEHAPADVSSGSLPTLQAEARKSESPSSLVPESNS
jgi:hypothetical protein